MTHDGEDDHDEEAMAKKTLNHSVTQNMTATVDEGKGS